MRSRVRAADIEPSVSFAGEPAFFGHSAVLGEHLHTPPPCPACGSLDLLTEPLLDDDELPSGLLLTTCATCGRELGELVRAEPAPESEREYGGRGAGEPV